MLKIDNKRVEIVGNGAEISAELEMLIRRYIVLTADKTSMRYATTAIDDIVSAAKEEAIKERQATNDAEFDNKLNKAIYKVVEEVAKEVFGGMGNDGE